MLFRTPPVLILLQLLCVAGLAGCAALGGPAAPTPPYPAPEFSLTSLDGRTVSLSDFRGKIVVIDFWASWCPPCREEFPHLQALADDSSSRRAGLVVLAINEREAPRDIRAFLDPLPSALTVLRDPDGTIARAYFAGTLPTTVIVGRDGTVRSVIRPSPDSSPRRLDAAIADALR